MYVKKIPPLDKKIGLPQRKHVSISVRGTQMGFEFVFRTNPNMNLIIMDIKRLIDNATMYRGAISQDYPIEIKDPVTKYVQFTLLPRVTLPNLSQFEIYIYEEE